jgi:hypothetical protein
MLVKNLIPDQPAPHATMIYCGNQGAVRLATEPKFYDRTKYIRVEHHSIRKQIRNDEIELQYISAKKQVPDGMTKPLPKDGFFIFRKLLGLELIT